MRDIIKKVLFYTTFSFLMIHVHWRTCIMPISACCSFANTCINPLKNFYPESTLPYVSFPDFFYFMT